MDGFISYVHGVEEFVYLLGPALVNYGSAMAVGMYQHTKYSSSGTILDAEPYQGNPIKSSGGGNKHTFDIEQAIHGTQNDGQQGQGANYCTSMPSPAPPSDALQSDSSQINQKKTSKGLFESPKPVSQQLRTLKPSNEDSQAEKEARQYKEQLRDTIRQMKVDLNEETCLDFADIAGLESVKIALEEFATFFLHFPHLTRNLRQRSTTGILLFGPQGTGKTLLIRSFAKKFGLALYDIRASAIMSKFVGESEKFVRALFEEVRAQAPAILMLDECDGLLCNPTADATQSHNYRLLQNELKNQWSDLIYSRDEVIVIGATNKPQDIDMDGFGRRLSLKLHVELPNQGGCQMILKNALDPLRHRLQKNDLVVLGLLCHERGLSGYDIDCLVEGQLRRAIRSITIAEYFTRISWDNGTIMVPCDKDVVGALQGSWRSPNLGIDVEEISYRPFEFPEIKDAISRARPTVDEQMRQKHVMFASLYGTDD